MSGPSLDDGTRAAITDVLDAPVLLRAIRSEGRPRDGALAVGVYPVRDLAAHRSFASRARIRGDAALSIALEPDAVMIGPLSRPEATGCGHCARLRIAGAALAAAPRRNRPAPKRRVGAIATREALRRALAILTTEAEAGIWRDHVLAIDVATGVPSRHRVIAMPQCPVCGGAAAAGPTLPNASRQPGRELPPDALLEQLSGWVDPRTGIVARLVLQPVQSSARGLPFVVTASPPHIVGVDGAIRRLPIGWGKGLDAATAVASAVGEAIERYAASLPDPSRIVWRRPDELDGDRLDPRAFALYADDQYARAGFPYVRFDPSIRHPWVRGTWLGSRSRVWVPAVLAFLALDLEPRQHFGQGTSNGLAASTDFDQAAVRATLEIVERDAFLATWFSGHAGRRIGVDDSIDPRLRDVLDGLSAMGAAVEIYQLDTSACGVTVLCLGLGDGDRWPGITLGLGADVDPRVAVRQAVLELGQTGPHLLHLMRAGQPPVPADAASVREMIDHAAYYFPPSRAAAFDALRGNGPPTALRDLTTPAVARTPAGLAAALASAGVRVAIVDVTSADVATGPFRVARAVSPDLQPLSYGSGYDRPMVARVRGLHRRGYTPAIHPIW